MRSGDAILQAHALGRAHHRALYFIARKPGLTVGELIALLGVTKQSLGRTLGELEKRGVIARERGQRDRRQMLLRLTASGKELESELFAAFREAMITAYSEVGPHAVTGFWTVLEKLLDDDMRSRAADLARLR